MADLKISELDPLSGAGLAADDAIAIVDDSASETKKIDAKALLQSGLLLIDDGSIPSTKWDGNLQPGSIDTIEIADGAVTAEKLADQSSGIYSTGLPASGAFVGQLAIDATDHKAYVWSGAAWTPFTGSAGLNTLTVVDNTSPVSLQVTPSGDGAEIQAALDPTTANGAFLAGPAASTGDVVQRRIVGLDLPAASSSEKGAVFVNGNGLTMNGETIAIDNTVTPSTLPQVVTYDANGLVTGGRAIEGADLPPATDSNLGVVVPAPDLTVDAGGLLTHTNQVVAGEGTKVSFDGNGHVTGTQALEASDLPQIPADQIIAGSGLDVDSVIPNKSITRPKLADYCIAYIQEASPSTIDPGHIGVLWYQESTGQLRMWNGNSFMPVGFGRLSNDNLRWGGLIDASTGLVLGVTDSGVNAGLKIGEELPAATNALGGLYVLVSVAGSQIGVTPGLAYDAGDWCLCVNEAEGWVRIDTAASGGGGGGGASLLNDLLDVSVSTAVTGDFLQLAVDGQWRNVSEIDGGTY